MPQQAALPAAPSLPPTGAPMPWRSDLWWVLATNLAWPPHRVEAEIARSLVPLSGATGHVSESSAPHCLVDVVRAVVGWRRYLGPDLQLALQQREPEAEAKRLAELSNCESKTFHPPAQGHSFDNCARVLHLGPKTISHHQTFIKQKLGVATLAALAALAALAHLALRHRAIAAPGRVVEPRLS